MKNKILLILLSLFVLTSCGSSSIKNEEENLAYDYAEEARPTEEYKGESELAGDEAYQEEGQSEIEDPDDYIERFVYIDLETKNYDQDFDTIKKSAKSLGGLIENESTFLSSQDKLDNLKVTDFTIKIPRDKVEKFDQVLADTGKTMSIDKNSNNLKTAFRDVDKDLEIKEKQLKKFNELLDKTNNIDDTLVINAKIIETQGEIDAIKKAKADLKNRVSYDTYNISLREVFSYDQRSNNPDLGSRIKDAMGESLNIVKEFFSQLIVGFFLYWPFILILIIIGGVIYKFKKNQIKNRD